MKKLAIAITSLLLVTGCSSTPTITNTNNIKEHILKDNVAYESFSSYSDSDSIIRLPNGEYIHGTKEVDGKYYDSNQDSGAIHYYEVEENEYFDYIKKIKEKGFNSIDPNSPEETFLGVNNDNISVNIHYDATNKTLNLEIRRQ